MVATTDKLTLRTWRRGTELGGVAYARKAVKVKKTESRNRVLKFFSQRQFPGCLSILSFPGVKWEFERQLLAQREPANRLKEGKLPKRTRIHCIERDEPIYRGSLGNMPGNNEIQYKETAAFARQSIRSAHITRYHLGEFENITESPPETTYMGAWLDFNGPINFRRMTAIAKFWDQWLHNRLVVTFMKARYDAESRQAIYEAGSPVQWLMSALPGSILLDWVEYMDGSPMAQVVFDKRIPTLKPVIL